MRHLIHNNMRHWTTILVITGAFLTVASKWIYLAINNTKTCCCLLQWVKTIFMFVIAPEALYLSNTISMDCSILYFIIKY